MAEKKPTTKKATSKTATKPRAKAGAKKDEGILVCTTAHLSNMFGISERQIYNLIDNGVVIKIGANKLDCEKSVANYINQMRKQEELKNQRPEQIKSMTEAVKLQHERFKTRKTELQVLQIEGKMHYEEDVKALWNSSVVAAKSKLSAIGSKLAPQLRGETETGVIQETIDREIYDALKEISEYDPADYETDFSSMLSSKDEGEDDE
jgi:hypothetical protein